MYNSNLENQLISPDIVDILADYVSIQLDIDPTRIKAAAIIAQKVDIERVIKKVNLERCIDPANDEDDALKALVIPAWCYYTYQRALLFGQGSLTDSGWTIEEEAAARNAAKSVAKEIASVGDVFMQDVIEFLESEGAEDAIEMEEKLSPKIRVFGGKESRACN